MWVEISWWLTNPCPDTAVHASALSPASWVSRSLHLYTWIYLFTVKNEPNLQKAEFCSPSSFLCCSQQLFGQHLARWLWTVNLWSMSALAVVISPEEASCPCFPVLALMMPCWKGAFILWGLLASCFLSTSQTPTTSLDFLWRWWSLLVPEEGLLSAWHGAAKQLMLGRGKGPGLREFVFSLLVHGQVKQFSILSWCKRLLLRATSCCLLAHFQHIQSPALALPSDLQAPCWCIPWDLEFCLGQGGDRVCGGPVSWQQSCHFSPPGQPISIKWVQSKI